MGLLSKMQYMTGWTQSEKQLVDYILKNPQEVYELSSKKLAEKTFSSVSTVYRVCDKLELNGFNELKLQIARDLNSSKPESTDFNMPFDKESTDYEIMQNLKSLYKDTIDETFSLLDLKTLHTAVSMIDEASTINIFTGLSNRQAIEDFSLKMRRFGRNSKVVTQVYDQEIEAIKADEKTVNILVSYSGKNRELETIVKILKGRKTHIILISSMLDHKYSKYADVHLLLCSKEKSHSGKLASYSAKISCAYLMDVIFSIIYKRHFDEFFQYSIDTDLRYFNEYAAK